MKYTSLAVLALVSASADHSIGELTSGPNDIVDMASASELHLELSQKAVEKQERANRIRDKINERESNEKNQRLYF